MQAKADHPPPEIFGVQIERIPDNLLLEPIEYIFADHCRQRDMCSALKSLTKMDLSTDIAIEAAEMILACLQHDLARHIEDEERDLFPLLKKRAKPEDKFDDTLRLLGSEHTRDRELANDVIAGLEQIAHAKPLPDLYRFRTSAEMLSEIHLSHLNWENNVVLELARLRLTDDDQRKMAKSMAARRGITLPPFD
ncbi:hemerythrin domain-containing protein [Magnetovibrio sp.]|uniref:hemerythrin domain-containing protein n=1 Tax=Magnetovibrio sp. TaxID=2024836 RepID=UPI002F948006